LHIYAVSSGAATFHLAPIFSGYTAAKTLVSPLTGWWSDCRERRDFILKGEWIGVVITTFTKEVCGKKAVADDALSIVLAHG
jgi:hypothetical protein